MPPFHCVSSWSIPSQGGPKRGGLDEELGSRNRSSGDRGAIGGGQGEGDAGRTLCVERALLREEMGAGRGGDWDANARGGTRTEGDSRRNDSSAAILRREGGRGGGGGHIYGGRGGSSGGDEVDSSHIRQVRLNCSWDQANPSGTFFLQFHATATCSTLSTGNRNHFVLFVSSVYCKSHFPHSAFSKAYSR